MVYEVWGEDRYGVERYIMSFTSEMAAIEYISSREDDDEYIDIWMQVEDYDE